MKTKQILPFAASALLLAACGNDAKSGAEPGAMASGTASAATATATASAEPKKLDSAGLEALADAVKFEQGAAADKSYKGKLTNSSDHGIRLLEYKAFAYDKDGKLIEMIAGKYAKALDAGKSADIEVGPFDKAAGKADAVEVVVSWMNVDGTSWQRPVPKDRAKGGPNNALKK